jgi:hypothetical protein
VLSVGSLNLGIDLLFLVVNQPFLLITILLLELNMLCSVLVDILEQVDSGLVLLLPLVFLHLPLLLGFQPCQVLNQLFLLLLVFSLLEVVLL